VRLFCLLALLAPVARAELVDRVAAVVNSDLIVLSEVEQRAAPELARVNGERDPAKRGEARAEILKAALDQLIGEKLLEGQLKELNLDVSEQEVDLGIEDVRKQNNIDAAQFEKLLAGEGYTLTSYRQFMKKQLAKIKLINLKVRSKVKLADEDVKAEYARYVKLASGDDEVHARHLLVQVGPKATPAEVETARAKALKLAEEARKPGVDFAELAKKKSEGPSAADGGDLGFFRRGVMVGEFEKAAFALAAGGISDPVRTKFGWHVLKVEERRALPPKTFDEMKDPLRERLMRGQLEKLTEQYINELRLASSVVVKLP
jgi:peptidyl-prolyl cis-trans isomerase SurA